MLDKFHCLKNSKKHYITNVISVNTIEPQDSDFESNHDRNPSEVQEGGPNLIQVKDFIFKVFLGIVGKMYAVPNMPRNFDQTIISDIIFLFEGIVSQISLCSTKSGNSSKSDFTLEILAEIISVLCQFSSDYRCLSFLQKSGCFIMPKPYVVGSTLKEKRFEGRIVSELVPLNGQYVPIKKVLECFFAMPGVYKEVLDYVNELENKTCGILSNFVQGALWKF